MYLNLSTKRLNGAKRLNGWNDWNWLSVFVRATFRLEKTSSKPLNRAIYTIFYRLINGLRWSDLEP
jgi:hypothetical protein